jgi:hypothetical protein
MGAGVRDQPAGEPSRLVGNGSTFFQTPGLSSRLTAAVRPGDRPAYIAALQAAQAGQGPAAFDALLLERLDTTLEEYLSAAREARPSVTLED